MLTVEIQINGECIERIHAVNISPENLLESEIHTYCVFSQTEAPKYKQFKYDKDHQLLHRRNDGAKVLARKMLEKIGGK
jgi:hypothetical protein